MKTPECHFSDKAGIIHFQSREAGVSFRLEYVFCERETARENLARVKGIVDKCLTQVGEDL